jgi:hypothetical protein
MHIRGDAFSHRRTCPWTADASPAETNIVRKSPGQSYGVVGAGGVERPSFSVSAPTSRYRPVRRRFEIGKDQWKPQVSYPKNARLVQAEGRHPLQTSSVVHQRAAVGPTARITVAQPTPRSRATAATAWASLPTRDRSERWLVGSAPPWDGSGPPAGPGAYPAGWLTTAPDPLAPGSTTGQPPLGRSRTRTMRRPWSSARAPRPLKSTAVAVVWTASRHSPAATPAARTSSRPSRAAWRPMHFCVDPPGASCLADVRHPQARRGPRCCSGRLLHRRQQHTAHAS